MKINPIKFKVIPDLTTGVLTLEEIQTIRHMDEVQSKMERTMVIHRIETLNSAVKAGLVALGWTPPQDN